MNNEKLKGRFHLKINHELKMVKKIEMYANEDVVFLLHKGRNFLYKLKKEEEKQREVKKKQEEEERVRKREEDKRRKAEAEE